jgi:hypothetical protein
MLLICGCSRGYDVDFPFDRSKAAGTWVFESGPPGVVEALGTNARLSKVVLRNDGTAEYHMIPLQTILDLSVVKTTSSQWKVVSGTNIWLFGNEHYGSQKVWTIMLETEETGEGFDVGRLKSGDNILVYKPDAESDDEPIIFRREK